MRSGSHFSYLDCIAHYFGLWLAVFALVGQVGLGATPPSSAMFQAEDGLTPFTLPICHTGTADDDRTPPHRHDRSDCALCPLCFAAGHTAAILIPGGIGIDGLPAEAVTRFILPPAHAPPSRVVTSTYPTGPPRRA